MSVPSDCFVNSNVKYFIILKSSPNGTQCIVQCASQTFANAPKNVVITVQHQGFWNTGKLRYPMYYRTREDLSWEEVLLDWINSTNK